MNPRNAALLLTMILLLSPALGLAQPKPTTNPTDFVIPELRFDNVPFDDVMQFLSDTVPGLQALKVLREPKIPEDYPRVTFRAKDISVGQLLDFFRKAYDVGTEEIDGPRGSIYVVRIAWTEKLRGEQRNQMQAQVQKLVAADSQAKIVRVYPLAGIAPNTKDPLADVMSLVQAAIEQAGVPKPTLKVHEPTRALLATGDLQALNLIENILSALKPTEDALRQNYEARLQEEQQKTRLMQVEFEGRLKMMEIQRAQLEQAMAGQRQAQEQAMKAQEAELRAQVRMLEQEVVAARARGGAQR